MVEATEEGALTFINADTAATPSGSGVSLTPGEALHRLTNGEPLGARGEDEAPDVRPRSGGVLVTREHRRIASPQEHGEVTHQALR